MINAAITTFSLDDPSFKQSFEHYINNINAKTHVAISSVTRPEIYATITSHLSSHFEQPIIIAKTETIYKDLKIAYKVIEQLGVDRWLALIATQHLSAPRIVIDAGSWIKMDVVLEQGQHQGGVIISKTPELEAYIFKRFALSQENCPTNSELFGTSTQQCLCLAKGHYGFDTIPMILTQWLAIIKQPCHIIVSGGDASQVVRSITKTSASLQNNILDIQHIENLVLSGLSIRYPG